MFYYKMRYFTTESGIRAQEFIQTILKYCPHPVKFCIVSIWLFCLCSLLDVLIMNIIILPQVCHKVWM